MLHEKLSASSNFRSLSPGEVEQVGGGWFLVTAQRYGNIAEWQASSGDGAGGLGGMSNPFYSLISFVPGSIDLDAIAEWADQNELDETEDESDPESEDVVTIGENDHFVGYYQNEDGVFAVFWDNETGTQVDLQVSDLGGNAGWDYNPSSVTGDFPLIDIELKDSIGVGPVSISPDHPWWDQFTEAIDLERRIFEGQEALGEARMRNDEAGAEVIQILIDTLAAELAEFWETVIPSSGEPVVRVELDPEGPQQDYPIRIDLEEIHEY